MKSREEIRFLALLAKTQERAARAKYNNNSLHEVHKAAIGEDKSRSQDDDWRLPKVRNSLSNQSIPASNIQFCSVCRYSRRMVDRVGDTSTVSFVISGQE